MPESKAQTAEIVLELWFDLTKLVEAGKSLAMLREEYSAKDKPAAPGDEDQSALIRFWVAWDASNEALERLPRDLIDDPTRPPIDRQSTIIRKRLQDVAGPLGSTRPVNWPDDPKVNLGAFIFWYATDEWRGHLDALSDFALWLRSLPKEEAPAEPPKVESNLATAADDEPGKRLDEICGILTHTQQRIIRYLWNRKKHSDPSVLADQVEMSDGVEAVKRQFSRLTKNLLENGISDVYLDFNKARWMKLVHP